MMRTEDDLRAVFSQIADEVDEQSTDLLARPVRRIRRAVVPVAIAAAVAAIVAVGAVISIGSNSRNAGISGQPEPQSTVFSADATLAGLPKGWSVSDGLIRRGATQQLVVTRDAQDTSVQCVVTVGVGEHAPGALNATAESTVGSHPAQIGRGDPLGDAVGRGDNTSIRVRWQPAANRWADATCAGDTVEAATARRAGEGLRLGAAPISVPWTAPPLPFDLKPNEVYWQRGAAAVPRVSVDLISGLGPSLRPTGAPDPEAEVFVIAQPLTDYVDGNGRPQDGAERGNDLDGRTVYIRPGGPKQLESMVTIVDGRMALSLTSEKLNADQLLQVAKAMTLAPDLAEERTWGSLADLPW